MSRAERRRAERAARKRAEQAKALDARRARVARRLAGETGETRPLIVRIALALWDAMWQTEHRKFWRIAGVISWVGWAMGIDTRDRRLPAWTGLNQDPDTPPNSRKPKL